MGTLVPVYVRLESGRRVFIHCSKMLLYYRCTRKLKQHATKQMTTNTIEECCLGCWSGRLALYHLHSPAANGMLRAGRRRQLRGLQGT